MKFVLTIWLKLIFLPVVSCEINKLYPKPGENISITFGKCDCNSIHWKNNDTGTVLCSCASSGCTSYASRYNCSNQDLNIKFDPSEDTFVIKAECSDVTEYYILNKPSPADTKSGQFNQLMVVTVVVVVVITVIIAVAGYFHCRKRRNDHPKNKINAMC